MLLVASPSLATCYGEKHMLALGLETCLCTFVLEDDVLLSIVGTDLALEKNRICTLRHKQEVTH